MGRRLQIDEGSEWLLPFALNRLSLMKAYRAQWKSPQLQRIFQLETGEQVFLRTTDDADDVRISGGRIAVFNGLHAWPSMIKPCNFTIAALPQDPVAAAAIPPSKRIVGTGLAPLGDVLNFSIYPDSVPGAFQYTAGTYDTNFSTGKKFRDFDALANRDEWMLRLWLQGALGAPVVMDRMDGDPGQLTVPPPQQAPLTALQVTKLSPDEFASYKVSLDYWRVSVTTDYLVCLVSQDSSDRQLLLGHFMLPPDTEENPNTQDTLQYFRGVTMPLSVLKEIYRSKVPAVGVVGVDVSSYNLNITADQRARIKVLGPNDYTRPQLVQVVHNFDPSQPTSNFQWITTYSSMGEGPATVVTYSAVIRTIVQRSADGDPNIVSDQAQTYSLEQHTLAANGAINKSGYDMSPFSGDFTVADTPTTILTSPGNCAIVFYTGKDLVQVGDYSTTEIEFIEFGPNIDGTRTWKSAIPGRPKGNIDEYIPEFGISRAGSDLIVDLGDRSNQLDIVVGGGQLVGIPFLPNANFQEVSSFSADTKNGFAVFGGGTDEANTLPTLQSARPIGGYTGRAGESGPLPHVGGVNWYRTADGGPSGVFRFYILDADFAAWTSDSSKYQNVFQKRTGYRLINNADGTTTPETHYEDLDAILARVVAKTHVLLNNFATPALYPWVTDQNGFPATLILI